MCRIHGEYMVKVYSATVECTVSPVGALSKAAPPFWNPPKFGAWLLPGTHRAHRKVFNESALGRFSL